MKNKNEQNYGRAPFLQKFGFGMGCFGEVLMSNIIIFLASPIYNLNLGVDAWLLGLAVSIPRIWDAVTDPVVGNISDNTRSRWGRRKPYILIGSILTGLLCFFMWIPPAGASSNVIFGYFLVISMMFFTTYTIFNIPLAALGFELSSDYDERTRVMSYKVLFGNFAAFCLPWAYKLCFVLGEDRDPVDGAKWVGLIFGGMMIVFGVFPVIFCKENSQAQHQKSINIMTAFKYTFKNKPYVILCGALSLMIIGFYLSFQLLLYMNLAIVCPGNEELAAKYAAYSQTAYCVMGIVTVPLIAWLGTRIGKRNTLMCGCVVVSIACLLSWVCFTPKYPLLQMVFSILSAPGMTCVWMLGISSIADICDVDELETGLRREGMYISIFGWFIKCAFAGTMVIGGCVITWSGFVPKAASQTPETTMILRVVFSLVPVLFLAAAFLLVWKYPLTKAKVLEIQSLLKKEDRSNSKLQALS